MAWKQRWKAVQEVPAVRTALFALGLFLMAASPAVGALPGPGGVFVFAAGLALSLKYSEWAKRMYVRFKRKHPRKGDWADWGLRRRSALRRHARRKAEGAAGEAAE
jgi:hypothetical protein